MLRTTNKSITDIALETGFSNSAYFTKVFKQVAKMTPREYRKGGWYKFIIHRSGSYFVQPCFDSGHLSPHARLAYSRLFFQRLVSFLLEKVPWWNIRRKSEDKVLICHLRLSGYDCIPRRNGRWSDWSDRCFLLHQANDTAWLHRHLLCRPCHMGQHGPDAAAAILQVGKWQEKRNGSGRNIRKVTVTFRIFSWQN